MHCKIRKKIQTTSPTPENDWFLKKQVLPIIIYANWHHILLAIFKQKKMRCIMLCQYKALLIDYCTVVIIVGRI